MLSRSISFSFEFISLWPLRSLALSSMNLIGIRNILFGAAGVSWFGPELQERFRGFARGQHFWKPSLHSLSASKEQSLTHSARKPQVVVTPLTGPYPGWRWDEYLPRTSGEVREEGVPPVKGWQSLMEEEESRAPENLDWLARSSLALGKDESIGSDVSRFAHSLDTACAFSFISLSVLGCAYHLEITVVPMLRMIRHSRRGFSSNEQTISWRWGRHWVAENGGRATAFCLNSMLSLLSKGRGMGFNPLSWWPWEKGMGAQLQWWRLWF